MNSLPNAVTIKEVGPRDGLQNEQENVSTADKIAWINQLSRSGYSYIEVSSFVHPKWIPQLADAKEVAESIERYPGVTYAALTPNMKGLERAIEADIDEVSIFMSASDTHNRKNINKSIADTYPILQEVVDEAKQAGKTVRGYVSTVFGCPYEGHVPVSQVIDVCQRLLNMGIDELSLGDTIGVANPKQVDSALSQIQQELSFDHLAMHFHNTRGMALANVLVSLEHGITTFDGALGGLGGCPYAKGASGNLATDDLVHMFHEMGLDTGISMEGLMEAGGFIQSKLGKALPSHHMQIQNRNQ
ncbi:hydroxymethylglutaryl-CoA lyase [Thalassobacillus sp. CUG 92003]|uniref:hydroxymethylglutaryl-CoA lyase n=1 Tax=Thalassobacillus sp. CUG 92003 TaxID=2736641 RepID=UPI0015E656A2|nr:hydroxymethylglutaryl-CoA lyase [Thalassobacillus sp. CUG 92003]